MSDASPNLAAVPADTGTVLPPSQGSPIVSDPGRVLGIVGFILSFVFPLDLAGLVICIIAFVKSRRIGRLNGLALAGIIISAAGILFSVAMLAVLAPLLINAGQVCAHLGYGIHVIGNSTYTCTPTSFNVTTNG